MKGIICLLATIALVQAGTLAPVTNTTFFDVEIDGRVVGQIQLGLFGQTVPKTVHNFAEICKGGHLVPRRKGSKTKKHSGSNFVDQMNFYITEIFKVNPLEFFRDPVGVAMKLLTTILQGPPKAAAKVTEEDSDMIEATYTGS